MANYLQSKIKTLNELIWEHRLGWSDVQGWLDQFEEDLEAGRSEQLHALFLLSRFSYFNSLLMRVLLRSLYRDLVQYPIVSEIRKRNKNTLDWASVQDRYIRVLKRSRFLGIGNPSESGTHLLYYFRQENGLPKELFLNPHELFEGSLPTPRLIKGVKRLIFLDDFCGSGKQAERYSRNLLENIRRLNPRMRLSYYPLIATTKGISNVRERTLFTHVDTLFELDSSFRALEVDSRYFREQHEGIDRNFAKRMCNKWGKLIEPRAPMGFGRCQLLLGFAHNIPNNTLPIIWSEGSASTPWTPIFKRYTKGLWW